MSEHQYLNLLERILETGVEKPDRTGVGTLSLFGQQIRFNLNEGFPLLTTKKIDLNSVLSELLWFLEGSTDERRLAEIRYGKPRGELFNKKTIWTDNAQAPYWRDRAAFDGDLGPIYGYQWCNFNGQGINQISNLVRDIKTNPYSRRHVLSAWNPNMIDNVSLPPCHVMAIFNVNNDQLSCMMTQRSQDVFLGAPYNYASYALLTHMLAQVCDLEVGELIVNSADTHIYLNHIDAVVEQLSREPRELPTLAMNSQKTDIFSFDMSDFILDNYNPYPAIKAPMAI